MCGSHVCIPASTLLRPSFLQPPGWLKPSPAPTSMSQAEPHTLSSTGTAAFGVEAQLGDCMRSCQFCQLQASFDTLSSSNTLLPVRQQARQHLCEGYSAVASSAGDCLEPMLCKSAPPSALQAVRQAGRSLSQCSDCSESLKQGPGGPSLGSSPAATTIRAGVRSDAASPEAAGGERHPKASPCISIAVRCRQRCMTGLQDKSNGMFKCSA